MGQRLEHQIGVEPESSSDNKPGCREYFVAFRVCPYGMKRAGVGMRRADARSFLKCPLGKAHQ